MWVLIINVLRGHFRKKSYRLMFNYHFLLCEVDNPSVRLLVKNTNNGGEDHSTY